MLTVFQHALTTQGLHAAMDTAGHEAHNGGNGHKHRHRKDHEEDPDRRRAIAVQQHVRGEQGNALVRDQKP